MQTVCLGNINAGELRTEFVQSLLAARNSENGPPALAETMLHTWGPYLDDARNTVVRTFLESSECDILLFVDSDIGYTPEHVRQIADAIDVDASPVVGGLYYSGFGRDGIGFAPVVYNWGTHAETGQPFFRQLDPSLIDETSPELIKVDAIGTGFLGIHRDLLCSMGEHFGGTQPWFAEEDFENVHHGEDMTFCHRLSTLSVPIFLSPQTRVKHYKVCAL